MFWQRIAENRRKTYLLFCLFFLLAAAVCWAVHFLLRNWVGPAVAALLAAGVGAGAIWLDQFIVLMITRPREATAEEHRQLANVVAEIAIAAQIPPPRCLVIDSPAANAFATGTPGKGVICVTTGLLAMLNRDELSGVIAHEMAHIGNHDTRVMTVAFVLAGMISVLCDQATRWGWIGVGRRSSDDGEEKSSVGLKTIAAIVVIVLAPIAAKMISLAVSRQREFQADAEATRLTRNPQGLASALRKLAGDPYPLDTPSVATAHLYIINPLRDEQFGSKLFSTHPPIEERIARLESM